MPLYDFVDMQNGKPAVLEFSMAEVVDWGKEVEVDGRKFRRVPSIPNLQPEFRGCVSMSQPRVLDEDTRREHVHAGRADGFSADGKPVFHTKKTARAWADATGGAVTWDD